MVGHSHISSGASGPKGNSILIEYLVAYEQCGGGRNASILYELVSFSPETSTAIRLQAAYQELTGSLKKKSEMCVRFEYECKQYSNFLGLHFDVTKVMLTDLMTDASVRIQ
jgi:hypothetical protein